MYILHFFPRNMLLTETDRIKLGDLGTSRKIDSWALTSNRGTWPYMSPEVRRNNYSINTDIWFVYYVLLF